MTNSLSVYISNYVKYCEAVCVSPWSERNVSLCVPLSFNNDNPFLMNLNFLLNKPGVFNRYDLSRF